MYEEQKERPRNTDRPNLLKVKGPYLTCSPMYKAISSRRVSHKKTVTDKMPPQRGVPCLPLAAGRRQRTRLPLLSVSSCKWHLRCAHARSRASPWRTSFAQVQKLTPAVNSLFCMQCSFAFNLILELFVLSQLQGVFFTEVMRYRQCVYSSRHLLI